MKGQINSTLDERNKQDLEDKDGDHIPDRIDGTYSADGHITQSDVQTADELNGNRPKDITEEVTFLEKPEFIAASNIESPDDEYWSNKRFYEYKVGELPNGDILTVAAHTFITKETDTTSVVDPTFDYYQWIAGKYDNTFCAYAKPKEKANICELADTPEIFNSLILHTKLYAIPDSFNKLIVEDALARHKDEQKKTESVENVSTQSEAKTVSYWRAVVTEDECSKLEKNNFPFDKSRKRTVEEKIPIRFKVELKQEFQKIISSSATIKVGGKIGG